MSTFNAVKDGIPDTMPIPDALEKFCQWVDKHGPSISGYFEMAPDDGQTMKYWLGFNDVSDRFGVFGSGPDGSLYALWIDDEGDQKVVHLGSEGEAVHILADTFVDFLRLLAIGYDELGHADFALTAPEWMATIGEADGRDLRHPAFVTWVEKQFHTTIPQRGNEITNTQDKTLEEWIKAQAEKYG